MLGEPQIVRTDAQETAIIRFTIPKDEIQKVMGPGMAELREAVVAQGIEAGPIFSHHFRIDPGIWDFEIGVPVSAPVSPTGRVKPGQLPATRVARTVYHGNYDGLGSAWGEFEAWMGRQGLTPAAELWEFYVAGPESSDDPKNWRTELNRPLTR